MADGRPKETADLIAAMKRKKAIQEKQVKEDAAKLERERPAYMDAAKTPDSISQAMQAGTDPSAMRKSPSDWIDHDIIDVKVADLPWPEGVTGPVDFEKINWEDAQAATRRLPEIREQLATGVQPDELTPEERRVYELYYGSRPVKLALIDGKYLIDSGRHRVYAAKALGLETLPARVKQEVG